MDASGEPGRGAGALSADRPAEVRSVDRLRDRRNTKWTRYGGGVLPAWVADMDFDPAPAVQAAMRRLVDEADYGYADRMGDAADAAVGTAFSMHQRRLYMWEPDPSLVVPLPDLVQAMIAAVVAFTEPRDGVVLQLPAYPPFISSIAATERTLVANPLVDDGTAWRLDVDQLEAGASAARMLMLCNPQNPTGRVFTREELEALGRVAVDHDLVIVCDEVHSELVYPGHRHLPLATLSREIAERTVTITSATKAYNIAGLRCAVMHFGSAALLERFRRRIPPGLLGHLSIAGIDATIAAWAEGGAWLARVLDQLLINRDRVAEFARRLDGTIHHPPQATYLAWLNLSALALKPTPWQFLFDRARVVTTAGEEFGPEHHDFVRLNFATSTEILEEILARIGSAIASSRADET